MSDRKIYVVDEAPTQVHENTNGLEGSSFSANPMMKYCRLTGITVTNIDWRLTGLILSPLTILAAINIHLQMRKTNRLKIGGHMVFSSTRTKRYWSYLFTIHAVRT